MAVTRAITALCPLLYEQDKIDSVDLSGRYIPAKIMISNLGSSLSIVVSKAGIYYNIYNGKWNCTHDECYYYRYRHGDNHKMIIEKLCRDIITLVENELWNDLETVVPRFYYKSNLTQYIREQKSKN